MPRPELLPTTSKNDLILIFLSATDIVYTSKVNDDWYGAHRLFGTEKYYGPSDIGGNPNITTYLSDNPGSTVGCKTQYQVCPPESSSEKNCIVSGGLADLSLPSIPREDKAYSLFPWIINYLYDIGNTIFVLSTAALTSRRTLNNGVQDPLPDNQWQLEVEYWHNIMLVSLQGITNAAIGPDDPEILKHFWKGPETDAQKTFCKSQVRLLASLYLRPQVFFYSFVTLGAISIALACVWIHAIFP